MKENERVSLQYSIALHELPQEVSRLVDKVATQLEWCHTQSAPTLARMGANERLTLAGCREVDALRDELTSAVCVLDDIHNIIEGFVKHQAQAIEPTQVAPSQEGAEGTIPPTAQYVTDPLAMATAMTELQQKLKLFQDIPVTNEEPAPTERE
tara:strand:- start:1 stop:459 length:459 start_codon:yes stop_codon:yes gene_type:complete